MATKKAAKTKAPAKKKAAPARKKKPAARKQRGAQPTGRSSGGSDIYEHDAPVDGPDAPVTLTDEQMAAIERHVAKHVGKGGLVGHEIVSDRIHLDLLPVEPSRRHPFKTFVTMGMSAVPMTLPAGYDGPDRLELCVVLPPTWPTDQKALGAKGDKNWWPLRWLKELARLPVTYDTWLGVGHTVPNGDPPEPLAPSCGFTGWMVVGPILFPDAFCELKAGKRVVQFLQIIPLYPEEMQLKLEEGFDALVDRFAEADLDPVRFCDPKRPNVCASGRGERPCRTSPDHRRS